MPPNYKLHIDSIMNYAYNDKNIPEWAAYTEDQVAPQNSEISDENVDVMYSSEEIEAVEGSNGTGRKDVNWRLKKIDRKVWELCNYNLPMLKEFPNNIK
jgi:hypothetical protein